MTSPNLESGALAATGTALGAWRRFLEKLQPIASAFAQSTDTAVASWSHEGAFWLAVSTHCPCSSHLPPSSPCPTSGVPRGRKNTCLDVSFEGSLIGKIRLCCDQRQSLLHEAFRQLVESAIRRVELEQENESLLEELGASWESLEAVYDISSDVRLLQDPKDLLGRITSKAAAWRDGLQAILWLQQGEQLEPVALECNAEVAPRDPADGLIGRVLQQRRSLVLNGRERISAVRHLESELQRATSVAISPVATRQGVLGVLEVWQDQSRRDFDSSTMRLMEALALQAAMVIENDRLYHESLETERLRREVEIGSEIQQVLLLGESPGAMPRLQVAALTIPSQRIDGDFYEFIKHDDQTLDLIVGDVMGKGIPAALVGAATKSHFLRAISRLLSEQKGRGLASPQEIVTLVASAVARRLIALESFVTLAYARFDTDARRVDYVNCGHTRTIHYQPRTASCRFLQGDNLPLGVIEGERYHQLSTAFDDGDTFLFYSDGVTEARDQDGDCFGEQQLAQLVQTYGHLEPEQLIGTIYAAVSVFSHAGIFIDDFTCVALKIGQLPLWEPVARAELDILSDLRELSHVRDFVHDLWQYLPASTVDEHDINCLTLAVNEAVTNIINHAYRRRGGQPIRFESEVYADRISVRIYDWGETFGPDRVAPPNFDGSRESGFGLFIISQSVDEVRYARDAMGRNCVSLMKRLRRHGERME